MIAARASEHTIIKIYEILVVYLYKREGMEYNAVCSL